MKTPKTFQTWQTLQTLHRKQSVLPEVQEDKDVLQEKQNCEEVSSCQLGGECTWRKRENCALQTGGTQLNGLNMIGHHQQITPHFC